MTQPVLTLIQGGRSERAARLSAILTTEDIERAEKLVEPLLTAPTPSGNVVKLNEFRPRRRH